MKCRQNLRWPWLSDASGRRVTKKQANKFMLGAIMDYQMDANAVWENTRILAEDRLGDPDDLWGAIANMTEDKFAEVFSNPTPIHELVDMPKRVRRIAKDISYYYGGDARKIWTEQPTRVIMSRLTKIKTGDVIALMIRGALSDTNQIEGKGDLKPDSNIKRVLSRIFGINNISDGQALRIADKMEPGNSWILDEPLFIHGKKTCRKDPLCDGCPLSKECAFHNKDNHEAYDSCKNRQNSLFFYQTYNHP